MTTNSKDEKAKKKKKFKITKNRRMFENEIKDDGLKHYFKIKQMKM